jgi:hypothetical protein
MIRALLDQQIPTKTPHIGLANRARIIAVKMVYIHVYEGTFVKELID